MRIFLIAALASTTLLASSCASLVARDGPAEVPISDNAATALATPFFVDATAAAGLDVPLPAHRLAPDCLADLPSTPEPGDFCFPEQMTAGAAAGDYDGDGHVDIFVTRLYAPSSLYRNRGDGTFEDVTAASGAMVAARANGAAFGDVDQDGDLDLYVTTLGDTRYYLFVNDGAGHFSEEAEARGASLRSERPHFGTTPTFADYDGDGDLDLYVGEWRPFAAIHDGPPLARLLRNRGWRGRGTFEDVTESAGVGVATVRGVYSFAGAFADLDGDGAQDLVVASDFHTARLFWGGRDGVFSDGTEAAGLGSVNAAMSVAIGDVDADGDLDFYVASLLNASQPDTGSRFFRNDGTRTLVDATDELGVRNAGWAWGSAMLDFDNDGDLDLLATNGFYRPSAANDATTLWANDGAGGLVEQPATLGLASRGQGRGLVVFDYDDDGDLDVFIAQNEGPPILARNEHGNDNAWLRVRAHGTLSNTEGVGVRVYLRATPGGPERVAEIGSTTSFLGQSERVAHFGLGPNAPLVAEVRVVWPASGEVQTFRDVQPRSTLDVREP